MRVGASQIVLLEDFDPSPLRVREFVQGRRERHVAEYGGSLSAAHSRGAFQSRHAIVEVPHLLPEI